MFHKIKTVVSDEWIVSFIHSYSESPTTVSASRAFEFPDRKGPFERTKYLLASCNGMMFPNYELAEKYMLEHGYLKPYYSNSMFTVCMMPKLFPRHTKRKYRLGANLPVSISKKKSRTQNEFWR